MNENKYDFRLFQYLPKKYTAKSCLKITYQELALAWSADVILLHIFKPKQDA